MSNVNIIGISLDTACPCVILHLRFTTPITKQNLSNSYYAQLLTFFTHCGFVIAVFVWLVS